MQRTLFAVWTTPGTGWDPAKGPRSQRLWDEHAAFMDDLFDRGSIVLAGPLADGSGSLIIVHAGSAEEVRDWFTGDPWSQHDILLVRDVKEWTIYLDGRTPRA